MRQQKYALTDLSNSSVSFKFGQHLLLHGHLQEIENKQIKSKLCMQKLFDFQ